MPILSVQPGQSTDVNRSITNLNNSALATQTQTNVSPQYYGVSPKGTLPVGAPPNSLCAQSRADNSIAFAVAGSKGFTVQVVLPAAAATILTGITGTGSGPGYSLNATGFYLNGVQIISGQMASISHATNSTDVVTKFNSLLDELKSTGLMASP